MIRPRLGRADWTLLLLAALSLAVPAAQWAGYAIDGRQVLLRSAKADVEDGTRILREGATRMLEADQAALDRVDRDLTGVAWDEIETRPGLPATLADVEAAAGEGVLVMGPEGRVLAASDARLVGQDFAAREFFTEAVTREEGLVIGRLYPDLGTSGWGLAVSRRHLGPDGRAGVVALVLSVDRVFALYRGLTTEPGDTASLLRADGEPILHFPPGQAGFRSLDAASPLRQAITRSADGLVRLDPPAATSSRLIGFSRVSSGGLVVAFGRRIDAAEAAWHGIVVRAGLTAGMAAVVLLLLAVLIRRQIARDRAASAQLAAALEQLRQSQKLESLGQLTGGVAHDFNNLLTVIQGNLVLLRRSRGDAARQDRLLDAVERAADRAAGLTRHLLAFARKQPLEPTVLDLNELMRGVLDLLLRSLPPNIRVVTDLQAGLPAILVDANQLESAILNIAVNARDAMPEGGTLAFTTGRVEGESMVYLAVADTGSGMDRETLARVFEPFFTTKEVGRGTGLGLSMVYGFVQQSGGRIALDSAPGAGTTVRIELPASRLAPAAPGKARMAGEQGGRVLLVEDQKEVAGAIGQMLDEVGFEVAHAPDAARALERLDEGFDVVLSDIFMPGDDNGLSFAQKLRKRDSSLPILLMTGSGQAAIEARAAGFVVLPKPFTLEALVEAISRLRAEAPAA